MAGCVLYAALAKCSWSVAKHRGVHRLTTVPLCRHLRNPFHLKVSALKSVPAYRAHSATALAFFLVTWADTNVGTYTGTCKH